jgi:hypothetical protein
MVMLSLLLLLQVKDTATRMLTNFSVQAGTNDFYSAQRLFKDPGAKALPQVCMLPCQLVTFARPAKTACHAVLGRFSAAAS